MIILGVIRRVNLTVFLQHLSSQNGFRVHARADRQTTDTKAKDQGEIFSNMQGVEGRNGGHIGNILPLV